MFAARRSCSRLCVALTMARSRAFPSATVGYPTAGANTPAQQLSRIRSLCRIAHVNGNDRRLAHFELKTALLQFTLEHFCVAQSSFTSFRLLANPAAQRRLQAAAVAGGCEVETEGRRADTKSSAHASRQTYRHRADGLAERSHLDVHAPVALLVVTVRAAAPSTRGSVRVIHHHDALYFRPGRKVPAAARCRRPSKIRHRNNQLLPGKLAFSCRMRSQSFTSLCLKP